MISIEEAYKLRFGETRELSDRQWRAMNQFSYEDLIDFAEYVLNLKKKDEKFFKALCYVNMFVDGNLLSKGIYSTNTPHLYSVETTIDDLIASAKISKDMAGNLFTPDSYFENLQKCSLEIVRISKDGRANIEN